MLKKIIIVGIACIVSLILYISCSSEDGLDFEETAVTDTSLLFTTSQNPIRIDNVIACAAGSTTDPDEVIAFVYPRPNATDIRFYETDSINVDKNDYGNYERIEVPEEDFINGYLKMFKRTTSEEKWIILSFFENDTLHLSNPIRLKHKTLPTEYTDAIAINTEEEGMPVFEWEDGEIKENAIYFQVISDATDEFLSGTYTFDQRFQYYILDNVVLNITEEEPPALIEGDPYNLTLMGVSEDNWVNLFIQRSFIN